jgi:hypothetical protein
MVPTTAHPLTGIILACTLLSAGWMSFDGTRGLVLGDYVRPKGGRFAGQLGPWAKVVRAIGINPESRLMKWIFIVYGTLWLVSGVLFALDASYGWELMLAFAIGSLWYLGLGTAVGMIIIVLLLIWRYGL